MFRFREIILPFIIVGVLSVSPIVHAEDGDIFNIIIDIQGIIDAIIELGENLGGTITGVPKQALDIFSGAFKGSLINFNDPLMELSKTLLTTNPDPSGLQVWWESIILVISSFYLLLFLGIGFMFLFASLDAEKRATAKEWLKNAFLMIVLINISFILYELLLSLTTAITNYLWISGFEQFFDPNAFSEMGSAGLIVYGITVFLSAITLFIRYVFLLLGVVLFPIGIFLYFIPPLNSWGRMIFNLIGIALFMQFIDVVILVASNQAMIQLVGNAGQNMVPALAFTIIFVLNILLMFYAVLKSIFTATENSKVLAFAVGSMAGQITGAIASLKTVGNPPPSKEIRL
jgi:hypothetical protein